jgi:hypothetical protein
LSLKLEKQEKRLRHKYYEGLLREESAQHVYIANQELGKYHVEISDGRECYTKSDVISIPENAILGMLAIEPWENLKIYPNPTPGLFTLEMDNPVMGELIIDIFGETGKKVINIKFRKETSRFMTQIDLSGQPAAVYLIGLALEEWNTTRRLVVE